MTDLAHSFPPASAADWRALVEKTLKGQPFESLAHATVEGLPIAPLYGPEGLAPAAFAPRPHDAERPWEVRVPIGHPDPLRANGDLLRDLEGGARPSGP
jgi:methylmalonyl-CoA mutase